MNSRWRVYCDPIDAEALHTRYVNWTNEASSTWRDHIRVCKYCSGWIFREMPVDPPDCQSGRKIIEQLFNKYNEKIKWPYGEAPHPGFVYAPHFPEALNA